MENKPLSLSELKNLEQKPKTRVQKILDRVICALPLLVLSYILLQYKLFPNFKKFTSFDANPPTDLYVYVVAAAGLLFLTWNILAVLIPAAFEKLRYKAPVYAAAFGVLALYDLLTLKTAALPTLFFPWPDAVLNAVIQDIKFLFECVWRSLLLLFSGYFTGVAAGLLTGLFAGFSKRVRYWVTPLLKVLGPIPTTTYIPLVIIVASTAFGGSVFILALGVWYPVTLTTLNGVINIPKSHFEAAQTFGASKKRLLFQVTIPGASPFIFQGLTQGMSVACLALMVSEMMGAKAGLGYYIQLQVSYGVYANMFAAIVILCLIFISVNTILNAVKKRVLRWQPRTK
jgi:NitT/TauT family transport system permease protein